MKASELLNIQATEHYRHKAAVKAETLTTQDAQDLMARHGETNLQDAINEEARARLNDGAGRRGLFSAILEAVRANMTPNCMGGKFSGKQADWARGEAGRQMLSLGY